MENAKPIRIFLADDHEIVATALAGLLQAIPGVGEVRTFSNGKLLYSACLADQPDLVILDLEMPEWDGLTTLRNLKGKCSAPVIMLSMNDERSMIEGCIREGARAYLHKNCSQQELSASVTAVLQGNIFLSEETKMIVTGLKQHSAAGTAGLTEPLTDKEYEVLQLVCEGFSSKEIGEKLFISSRTVETRKNRLMEKFNVQTTGKLIALALKNKIVK